MATIVSASYTVEAHEQEYDRRYVHETFIDDAGKVYENIYLARPDTDYDAVLAEHQAQIQEQLDMPTEPPGVE